MVSHSFETVAVEAPLQPGAREVLQHLPRSRLRQCKYSERIPAAEQPRRSNNLQLGAPERAETPFFLQPA